MTVQEVYDAMQKMNTSDIQPTGGDVARWYEDVEPSPTDLLYMIAFLLHRLNTSAKR